VVIAGGEAAGQRVLKGIWAGGHHVVAAFAGSGTTGAPVRDEATRLGVPVLPAVRVKDPAVVGELGPIDLLVNVHSLFVIVPELLDWPALGAYNVHPGWLPDFAGRNCPSWAVWLGEPEPGVTVHRMVAEIDRGAVAFQDRFPAGAAATGGSVAVECAKRGIALVNRLVDALVAGDLDLRHQDPGAFTYFGRDVPDDGRFQPDRTAVELDRDGQPMNAALGSAALGRAGFPSTVTETTSSHSSAHATSTCSASWRIVPGTASVTAPVSRTRRMPTVVSSMPACSVPHGDTNGP
jgi:methionyl-tRNA formyltransferase